MSQVHTIHRRDPKRLWCALTLWSLVVALLLAQPIQVRAALTDLPTAWSNFVFGTYTYLGQAITDDESSSDPSNGGTGVQPESVDIASCSPDGKTPGFAPSVQVAYYDQDGNPLTLSDAYLAFRVRLADTPAEGGQNSGYRSAHWNILIDIDGDGYKEFVLDLDGTVQSQKPDRLYLLYNNLNTQEVAGRSGAQRAASDILGGDELALWYASGPGATGDAATYNHTRVLQDTSQLCSGTYEYWLDMQVPLTAFSVAGQQLITPFTPIAFFYSTSTSNTNPLQKDWMMDPNLQGGSGYIVTDPITFGDTYWGVEPTAVTLASFQAQAEGGTVWVRWQTGVELENLGFNLYREGHPGGGDRVLLNPTLIPSKALGTLVGASYTYRDATVAPETSYAYWLEAWDIHGGRELYGPAVVQVPTNQPPRAVRAWPNDKGVPLSRWQVFAGIYRDADGFQDMAEMYIAIGSTQYPLKYDALTGLVHIWNGRRWSRGKTLGERTWLAIPQMAVGLMGTDLTMQSDQVLRIRWQIKCKAPLQGEQGVWIRVVDLSGADSGWQHVAAVAVQ